MIAIGKPPRRRKRPDPPWPIDAHANVFAKIDQTFGPQFFHPSTLQIPRHDPFSSAVRPTAPEPLFASPGLGAKPASELKYSLYLNFEVGNPNPFPIAFDTVVIRFDHAPVPRNNSDAIEQTTIFTEDGKIVSDFSYAPVNFKKSPSDEKPRQLQVEGRTGIGLSAFALGGIREIEKQYASRFILQLFHREVAVSRPIVASIPHEVPIPVRDLIKHGVAPFEGLPVRFSQY